MGNGREREFPKNHVYSTDESHLSAYLDFQRKFSVHCVSSLNSRVSSPTHNAYDESMQYSTQISCYQFSTAPVKLSLRLREINIQCINYLFGKPLIRTHAHTRAQVECWFDVHYVCVAGRDGKDDSQINEQISNTIIQIHSTPLYILF